MDECRQGMCRGGQCLNNKGGFQCLCPVGHHVSSDGYSCINFNECGQSGFCANGVCVSDNGSFKCQCNDGFTLSPSGLSCIDIDECRENPEICLRGQCRNTQGAYICECDEGFTHSADGAFCTDENECSHFHICQNGQCINKQGGFNCICDPGYELTANGRECEDIDECASSPCFYGQCINTNGGFHCNCGHGFILGPDGRTCTDTITGPCYTLVQNGHCMNPMLSLISKSTCCCNAGVAHLGWGLPCHPCPLQGTIEFSELCPHGSGFTNSGEDINECAQDKQVCENGACENLMGSYRCICNPGYEVDVTGRKCVDIDECLTDPLYCSGGTCKNTPGSFECICPTGTNFNADSKSCEDIDECLDPEICGNGICTNTQGSFQCGCPQGTKLDPSGQYCLDSKKGHCWTKINRNGQCESNLPTLTLKEECCCSIGLAWGSPCQRCGTNGECECQPGFFRRNGKTCSDINECLLNPDICEGGFCINTEGSFLCQCPSGLHLDDSGTKCVDERVGPCFTDYRQGVCKNELGGQYKRDHCCCSVGEAWGDHCIQCPRIGTKEFERLCPKGN